MIQYKYKAQTLEGKTVSGTMKANDEADLHSRLREGNMYLLSAKEIKQKNVKKQFKARTISDFSRQLGTLIGSGVTLVRALNIIARGESVKPKERAVYEDMLNKIKQGISLSDAMEAQGGVFPILLISMYRSAEASGNLDQVAMKMAELYDKQHKLNGKISTSMTYPKILGFLVVAVILILTNFVMPQLEGLLSQMDELPPATKLLYGISGALQDYWYLFILFIVLCIVGWRWLMMNEGSRRTWHKIVIHIPVFGKLQKVICTARFAQTLSSLYSAGTPIVQALQIARSTAGNDYIDQQFEQVIPFVRAGNNLSDGLDMIDGFVGKLSDAVRVGEETGNLDHMLIATSDSLEYDADVAITKIVSYVEPCMMIVMGVIVAFVLVAVFQALYGSYDAIAGME